MGVVRCLVTHFLWVASSLSVGHRTEGNLRSAVGRTIDSGTKGKLIDDESSQFYHISDEDETTICKMTRPFVNN